MNQHRIAVHLWSRGGCKDKHSVTNALLLRSPQSVPLDWGHGSNRLVWRNKSGTASGERSHYREGGDGSNLDDRSYWWEAGNMRISVRFPTLTLTSIWGQEVLVLDRIQIPLSQLEWWKHRDAGAGNQTRDPEIKRLMIYRLSYLRPDWKQMLTQF